MNETLKQMILKYATGAHGDLSGLLDGLSRVTLASTLTDLLTVYFNDRNSSKGNYQGKTNDWVSQHKEDK